MSDYRRTANQSKLIRIIVCVAVLCVTCIFSQSRINAGVEKFTYEVVNGQAVITEYSGQDTVLTIPDVIDDYAVVGIGDYAFQRCSTLKSVTIPDSITSIGKNPFLECGKLQAIAISPNHSSYAVIGSELYEKATKKLVCSYASSREVTIPDGIEIIGVHAFDNNYDINTVYLPSSLNVIEERAFADCKNLHYITLPENLTVLGDFVFDECSGLKEINLPDSLNNMGKNPFANCQSLDQIDVSDDHSYLSVHDEVIYITSEQKAVCCFSTKDTITLMDDTHIIGAYAFALRDDLISIEVPDSVTDIEEYAFDNCFHMRNVKLPEGLLTIGDYAFNNTDALESINLPASLQEIGIHQFHKFLDMGDLIVLVVPGTLGEEFCQKNEIPYQYQQDNLDWLK